MIESVKLRQKRPGVRGYLAELFVGRDLRKSVGDFVRKLRLIDHGRKRYVERIETEDGTVLRNIDDALV
jgi:hypothetical protein